MGPLYRYMYTTYTIYGVRRELLQPPCPRCWQHRPAGASMQGCALQYSCGSDNVFDDWKYLVVSCNSSVVLHVMR